MLAILFLALLMASASSINRMVFVEKSEAGSSSFETSGTITTPAGTADGDIMTAFITCGDRTISAPAGWSLVGSANDTGAQSQMWVFRRIISGTPPADTTFNFTGGNTAWAGTILTHRRTGGGPQIGTGVAQVNSSSSTNIEAPSCTAPKAGLVLRCFSMDDANTSITPPGSMTERSQVIYNSTRGHSVCEEEVSVGATGAKTATITNADTSKSLSVVIY